MQAPVITAEVAMRIESALANAMESRIRHVQRLDGNPLGVELRRWGHITGVLVRGNAWYYPYFNEPSGVGSGDEHALDEVLAWYRGHEIRCRVAISPFHADEHLLQHLTLRGLRQSSFMTVLFGTPEPGETLLPSGVTPQAIEVPSLDPFLNLWLSTAPEEEQEFLQPIVRAEFAEWRCYVGFVDGQPAGAAALHVHNGVGTLAAGMTLPEFRGRGCQTALLRQRVADAHAMGCDLVLSQATPGSVSQRNMERVGFRTAYTKAIWIDR